MNNRSALREKVPATREVCSNSVKLLTALHLFNLENLVSFGCNRVKSVSERVVTSPSPLFFSSSSFVAVPSLPSNDILKRTKKREKTFVLSFFLSCPATKQIAFPFPARISRGTVVPGTSGGDLVSIGQTTKAVWSEYEAASAPG